MTVRFCSLASGSSGNCHLIHDNQNYLLVDAGLSGKQIENKLKQVEVDPKNISGILVSHEHNDHIYGVGILSRRYNIPIYANYGTWEGMENKIGKVKEDNIKYFDSNKAFSIGNFHIMPYSISHDARDPVGFSFQRKKIKVSIATDLGYISDDIIAHIGNSDLVVLESNHDEEMVKVGSYPYPLKRRILSNIGHLSNNAAGRAAVQLVSKNVKSILLAHLSRENNFPELALATVKGILDSEKIMLERDVSIDLAYRDRVSSLYEF